MAGKSFWDKLTGTTLNNLAQTAVKALNTAARALMNASSDTSVSHNKNTKAPQKENNTPANSYKSADSQFSAPSPSPTDVSTTDDFRMNNKLLLRYAGHAKYVQIPEGVEVISAFAFDGNASVEEVIIPNSVSTIRRCAFRNCKSLRKVKLPNNRFFNILEAGVFQGCGSLKEIAWPRSIKLVMRDSIEGCPLSPQTMQFLTTYLVYSKRRNAFVLHKIAESDKYSEPGYKRPATKTSVTHANRSKSSAVLQPDPDNTLLSQSIHASAAFAKSIQKSERFDEYPNLFIKGDTLIGIFDDLPIPEDLVIPNFIRKVDVGAFNLACNVKSIVFKGIIRNIAQYACTRLPCLETLRFEAPVERIDEGAFFGCEALRKVRFEHAVLCIEKKAFSECKSLKTVLFGGKLDSLWDSCFEQCESLEQIDIPDSCEIIGQNCFLNCTSLRRIHLPAKLRRIMRGAFANCSSLESFTCPEKYWYDKHEYPKFEPFIFSHVLSTDRWERFTLKEGEFRRTIVAGMEEDPEGLFDMLPETINIVQRLPQLAMNIFLNAIWESSFMNPESYDCQMDVLRTCFRFARILLDDTEDNRADYLFILEHLRLVFHYAIQREITDKRSLLPYAISETLFAICGRGSVRKSHDKTLIQYLIGDTSEEDYTRIQQMIWEDLHIGPGQKGRYSQWKTKNNVFINMDDIDYDTFSHEINILVDSVFKRFIHDPADSTDNMPDIENVDPEDPSDATAIIHTWCMAWNQAIHEELSPDVHLVFFHPFDMETKLKHETQWGTLTLLTMSQLQAIRTLLAPFDLCSVLTSYTLELQA